MRQGTDGRAGPQNDGSRLHNGAAATLDDVVASYDRRFEIGLSAAERRYLAAFLRAL